MNRAFSTVSVIAALGMFVMTGCCQQCGEAPTSDDRDSGQPNLVPVWEEAAAQDGEWGNIKGRVVWGPKDIPERTPIGPRPRQRPTQGFTVAVARRNDVAPRWLAG